MSVLNLLNLSTRGKSHALAKLNCARMCTTLRVRLLRSEALVLIRRSKISLTPDAYSKPARLSETPRAERSKSFAPTQCLSNLIWWLIAQG